MKIAEWTAAVGFLWAIALIGGGAVATRIGPWYRALQKPPWKPSDRLFGPVWTIILLLAGGALVLGWRASGGAEESRALLLGVYVLNGVLNLLWSILFFRVRRPDWALWEITPLWLSIIGMILVLRPISVVAAWLLTPYLVWVSFAWMLNRAIVRLNEPFGGV